MNARMPHRLKLLALLDTQVWIQGPAAVAAAIWVKFPPSLITLMTLMTLDLVSGLAAAGAKGSIDSTICRKGMWRKLAKLAAGIAGFVASRSIPPMSWDGQEITVNLGAFVCGAFIVSELISILENVGNAGGTLPRPITRLLAKLREVDENK